MNPTAILGLLGDLYTQISQLGAQHAQLLEENAALRARLAEVDRGLDDAGVGEVSPPDADPCTHPDWQYDPNLLMSNPPQLRRYCRDCGTVEYVRGDT